MLEGLNKVDTRTLICLCIDNDRRMKDMKKEMDALKAELQARGGGYGRWKTIM